jgi:maltose O-acetyltransferase
MTEREKMLRGDLYNASDPDLVARRTRARALLRRLNTGAEDERPALLRLLFGAMGEGAWVEPPFMCDYGENITVGANVFFNFNCVVLDVAPVTIGDHVKFGPNVQLYTATHPLESAVRRTWLELARPIHIGSDAWIGGGAIVCPGVTVGEKTIVGAGSVVTRSLPAGVLAVGNPARIIRDVE